MEAPQPDFSSDSTLVLLRRYHSGDPAALGQLVERDIKWIHDYARPRLCGIVRDHEQTGDIVHDAILRILRAGPRFEISNKDLFRKLIATVVVNVLRSKARRFSHRAAASCEGDAVLDLDGRAGDEPSPIDRAADREAVEWLHLAEMLLPPDDHDVLQWSRYEYLSHKELAERLVITTDAARVRVARAIKRLKGIVRRLQSGHLDQVLAEANQRASE